MSEEKFLMVSLKEKEAKKLAQVMSNDTSRKILEHLSSVKSDTETGIAKKMDIPISTVHYNLAALQKARLIEVQEFHYSEKGKEVNHYSLANKYVIIAPKEASESLRSKLKRILPVSLTVIGASVLIQLFSGNAQKANLAGTEAFDAVKTAADGALQEPVRALSNEAVHSVIKEPNIALWFLFGSVFAILAVLLVDYLKNRN